MPNITEIEETFLDAWTEGRTLEIGFITSTLKSRPRNMMSSTKPKLHIVSQRVTTLEEDQAMAIRNMHKKFGTDHACGTVDILADRQTDRDTHTHKHTDVLITILRNYK